MKKQIFSWTINDDKLTASISFGDCLKDLIEMNLVKYENEKYFDNHQPEITLIIRNQKVAGALYPKSKVDSILGINTQYRGAWPIDDFIKEINKNYTRSPEWDNKLKFTELSKAKGLKLMQVVFRDAYPSLVIKIQP